MQLGVVSKEGTLRGCVTSLKGGYIGRLFQESLGRMHLGLGLVSWVGVVRGCLKGGSGGSTVEPRTVNRGDSGSIPPTAISKLLHPTFACVFRKRHL